jgi:ElaB/YqjD/DUF883 family membrane-anchored ribosome-binding protein
MENEELIRQRMEETRESLTDKLETLEDKLMGSVHEATSAVRETVANVKETMHEGVESVKEVVDVQAHVQRRPWLMFGGAVVGGYLLGSLLTRESAAPAREPAPLQTPPRRQHAGNGHHKPAPKPEASTTASFLNMVEPEIRQLKGLALGVALGTVREILTKEVPPHLADELRSIIDGVTRKIGGEPVPGDDLPFQSAKSETESESSPFGSEPRW